MLLLFGKGKVILMLCIVLVSSMCEHLIFLHLSYVFVSFYIHVQQTQTE